ncbi:hypothetical protein BJX96DRAFT_16043 [Aspergillus floccosus]
MPPPLGEVSDDESTGSSIPYNDAEEQQNLKDEDDDDDIKDEDEDEDEGVYVVEKIVGHEFAKNGKLLLQVKWKGYDDPADMTMEPEENLLEGAKELVEDYYTLLGGRPQKTQGRKRKSMGAAKQKPDTAEPKKRRKSQPSAADTASTAGTIASHDDVPDWVPKKVKNWESYVVGVDTIIRDPETQSLIAYLHWTNGKKSKVSISTCYDKCPRKMLEFYEKHLVFKEG